jgi:hypothetical protein
LELAGATLITPDTVVGGSLDPANETDLYRFTVTAGDQFNFDSLTTAVNNARWRLLDPYGQQVFFNVLNTDSSQTLNLPGTYTLLVE